MDVHAAHLGAAMQGREDLARIEQELRIKGALDPLLMGQIDLGEHGPHQVALFHPNPVLARQHAANLDTEPQNVGAKINNIIDYNLT